MQAELIMEQIRRFGETGEMESVCTHHFRPVFSGSCGCPETAGRHFLLEHIRQQSELLYNIENEEWTYKADRNENGYLGVWILL